MKLIMNVFQASFILILGYLNFLSYYSLLLGYVEYWFTYCRVIIGRKSVNVFVPLNVLKNTLKRDS